MHVKTANHLKNKTEYILSNKQKEKTNGKQQGTSINEIMMRKER